MPPRRAGRPRQNVQVPENEPRGNEEVPQHQPPQDRRIEEMFLRQNPPVFDGMGDPATAETWIRRMERIFNFLRCTDEERLNCVAFQLTGSADFWWEAQRKTMTPEQLAQLTWEQFKTEIYDKYIPSNYRKEKEIEFFNLEQGKMSVTEYDRTFCDMSRYAPELVNTDAKRAEKFRAGLRHEIRMALASNGELTYKQSLSRALNVESAMPKEKAIVPAASAPPPQQQQNAREKRKWDGDRTPYENKRQQHNPSQNDERQVALNQTSDFRPRAPQCVKCFKNHFGECRVGTNKCYTCGGSGHFSRECSNRNVGMGPRQNYQRPRPQLQARQTEPSGDLAQTTQPQQEQR